MKAVLTPFYRQALLYGLPLPLFLQDNLDPLPLLWFFKSPNLPYKKRGPQYAHYIIY